MKIARKLLSLFLFVCLSLSSLPAFASAPGSADAQKIKLADSQMKEAVGGTGSLDAVLDNDFTGSGGNVFGHVTNRSHMWEANWRLIHVTDPVFSWDLTANPYYPVENVSSGQEEILDYGTVMPGETVEVYASTSYADLDAVRLEVCWAPLCSQESMESFYNWSSSVVDASSYNTYGW